MKYLSLCLLFLIVGCTAKKEKKAEQRMPVKVLKASMTVSSTSKHYVGQIEGSNESILSFQVMGNVQKVFVEDGSSVRKGQLLAQLDPINLRQAYKGASATLNRAKDAYDRMQPLYKSQSISAIDWKKVETAYEQALAAETVAKKKLSDAKLYAPYAGIIASRSIEMGENVAMNQPVFTLCKIDAVHVTFAVPENEIGKIKKQTAEITVAALNGAIYTGQVAKKSLVASTMSHAYTVKLRVENKENQLLPGMVCDVHLNMDALNAANAVVLPNRAVQVDNEGGRFVWTVVDGKAKQVFVEIGELTDKGLVITKGLQAGDLVVVEGYQRISKNMRVRIL